MKMLYTLPLIIVVIIWGISLFFDLRFNSTIFHRKIWISSTSGAFRFEYDGETTQDKFFDPGQVYRAELIHKKRSAIRIKEGSGFLFKKVRISRGWIRMIRVPYWALFAITFIGTVSLYVANRVGTRV